MSAISDNNPLYRARKRRNAILLSLSVIALAYGLLCLLWILAVLLIQGGEALSHITLFTQMTPPPGSDGGLHRLAEAGRIRGG